MISDVACVQSLNCRAILFSFRCSAQNDLNRKLIEQHSLHMHVNIFSEIDSFENDLLYPKGDNYHENTASIRLNLFAYIKLVFDIANSILSYALALETN